MAVNAKFSIGRDSDINFKAIEGYRISAFFSPAAGFNGNFYIFIHELVAEQDEFKPISLTNTNGGRNTGTLSFNDQANERNYSFNDIDLISVQPVFTHQQKERVLTFQYRAVVTDNQGYCEISNSAEAKSVMHEKNAMGKTYKYSTGGAAEPSLLFGARLAHGAVSLFRIGGIRNNNNSFLELCMSLDKARQAGPLPKRQIMVKDFSVDFDQNSLQGIFVDESYGSFLNYSISSLDKIAATPADHYGRLSQISFSQPIPRDYLDHMLNPQPIRKMNQLSSTETCTVVLLPNNGYDLLAHID